MNAESCGVVNIDSIEELTLHSLQRSEEGLEELRRESRQCGELFAIGMEQGLSTLADLATHLRDFHVFEQDIVSLFQIDTEGIRDAGGNLKTIETRFASALAQLTERLDGKDATGLVDLFKKDIPNLLDRFQDLFVVLGDYIQREYIGIPNESSGATTG